MFHVLLSRGAGETVIASDTLISALRRTGEKDGLEHARLHMSRAGARGVLFMSAPTPSAARNQCRELVARTLAEEPSLTGWQLSDCSPLLPS